MLKKCKVVETVIVALLMWASSHVTHLVEGKEFKVELNEFALSCSATIQNVVNANKGDEQ